jgi:hypothetical protein
MTVTWTTLNYVSETFVEYGISRLDQRVNGSARVFNHGGKTKRETYVHQVLLNDLIPGQQYRYHCGSPKYGWSAVFFFTAMRNDQNWTPKFAVYGDLGNTNVMNFYHRKHKNLF